MDLYTKLELRTFINSITEISDSQVVFNGGSLVTDLFGNAIRTPNGWKYTSFQQFIQEYVVGKIDEIPEGKGIAVLDQIGLAQKGGAVTTHVRIAEKAEDIHAVRIAAGGARAVIGCDLVVTGAFDSLAKMEAGKTNVVVNSHETPTGNFASKPDLAFPSKSFLDGLAEAVGQGGLDALDASRIATALLGD